MSAYFIIAPVCALLVGVLLQVILSRVLSSKGKGWLAFGSSLAALAGVLFLWPVTQQGNVLEVRFLDWDGPITLAYHVDGLSQLFALMAVGIGAAILLYSIAYMAHDRSATRFYILMLVFIAGLVHLVYSSDLFLVYLSWEVIGLCSFLLVGFWYRQKEAAAGARKVLVMTHIAGYALLAAIIIIYTRTGSTIWTDPRIAAAFNSGLFLLMVLAAVAKSVQFPLHTWIPDAMAAPTPVSALLHAACYVKAGVYLIARLHSLCPWPVFWQDLVIWIGTITLLVGGLYAMVQSDLKRLLAFSTVSQIGYMVLALGLSTPLGIAAGLLHCLNHGLFKGGLFLCAGAIQQATGTRDMDRMGGLGRYMPATFTLWLIGAGAIAGVPLLSGFVSKWLIYNAALQAGHIIPALISWVVSVITVFYFLKATSGIFLGDVNPGTGKSQEAPKTMLGGAAILGAGSILLGIAPQFAVRYVINPLLPALGTKPVIGISWLGLTAGSGSWLSTVGLILVLLAVGIGILIYRIASPSHRREKKYLVSLNATDQTFSGGEPLAGPTQLPASDFSLIIKKSFNPFYRWFDVDRYYLTIWRTLLRVCDILGNVSKWLEKYAIPVMLILVLLFIILIYFLIPGGESEIIQEVYTFKWPILFGIGLALLAMIMSSYIPPISRINLPLIVCSGLLVLIGLSMDQSHIRLIILEASAFAALFLVWKTCEKHLVRFIYMVAVILSAVAMIGGTLLMENSSSSLVIALVLIGFIIKLALIPIYLWLPIVAERTPAPVVGLLIGVVDIAAFGELLILRQTSPWLFAQAAPWLITALISVLGGAILMLAQRHLKRFLAFSTIEDMGYLLLAVTVGGELGLTGAALGASVHALAKALLFSSITGIETNRDPLILDVGGMASRYPLAGVGFLIGTLAMLGIPPTMGYAARWRLYGAAAHAGLPLLFVLLAATALSVLAYARVIAIYWWGPGDKKRRPEQTILVFAIIGLSLVLLLFGLCPGLLKG